MTAAVTATVVVTGDEVLAGRVGDRNGRYLAEQLVARGVALDRIVVLGDETEHITAAVRDAAARGVDLVVTTGGLGVTHDDLTMAAVAQAAGVATELDATALELVQARTRAYPLRSRIAPEIAEAADRKQATLPVGGVMVPPAGTAPGSILRIGGAVVVVLPGPPREVAAMWPAACELEPLAGLLARAGGGARTVLRLHDVIEAQVVEAMAAQSGDPLGGLRMGICARPGELEIVLTEDPGVAGAAARFTAMLHRSFGAALFSTDGATVTGIVAEALRDRGATLAVAESCTGGMLGARITDTAGSSEYFVGGVLSYADAVKRDLLGVPADLLEAHGAVSEQVAAAMAEGVRRVTGADWGVSVTGIAGPGGGSAQKPVGLVYFGCSGPDGTTVAHRSHRGGRDMIRDSAVVYALHLLRGRLTA